MKKSLLSLAVALALSAPTMAEELPLGELTEGSSSSRRPASYTLDAEEAGALTLVARSTDGNDVVLIVTDESGQQLVEGRIDADYHGDYGAEQGVIILSRPGEYQVYVMPYGDEVEFALIANFMPWSELEVPADEDGSPLGAIDLEIGEWIEGEVGYDAGDDLDWYRYEAEDDGTLTVETRGSEGDVVLELFEEDEYLEPLDSSDQDLDDEYTNEMLTLEVEEGDVYLFRVRSFGGETEYEITASTDGGGGGSDRPRSDK